MLKKLLALGIIVLFVFCNISFTTLSDENSSNLSNTVYVGGSGTGNYSSIQSAIDAATVGDTVFVYNGTYYENVIVYKTIHMIGESRNGTIIDGGNIDSTITITSDYVSVERFCVIKCGLSSEPHRSGTVSYTHLTLPTN